MSPRNTAVLRWILKMVEHAVSVFMLFADAVLFNNFYETPIEKDTLLVALLAEEKEREKKIRNKLYYENVVPRYNLEDFRSHFRMKRRTVSVLENLLAVRGGHPPMEVRKQLLITLWILRNPECLHSDADRFDVCRATTYRVYR